MKKYAKLLALSLVAALGLTSFAACSDDSATTSDETTTAETFVIGGVGPLTGVAASYGISVNQGAQYAVDEINANGGVEGLELKLIFEDDEHDAEKALNAYNTLMDQGAQAIVGAVTSVPCIALTEVTSADNILQITPSASAAACAQYDNCFRICFTDPQQGQLMAQYIMEQGITKTAIIYDNSDAYSKGIYEAFEAEYTALGGEVVAAESFNSGDVDFKTQLTKIKATDAEALFLPIYYTEAAYIASQADSVGVELPYFGCDGWDGIIAQVNGDTTTIEGATFLTPFVVTNEAENIQTFVAGYEDVYGTTPDQFAADGYDAVYAIAAALEVAGADDSQALIDAMYEIEIDGLTGHMTFDENGDATKSATVAIIEDGAYIGK